MCVHMLLLPLFDWNQFGDFLVYFYFIYCTRLGQLGSSTGGELYLSRKRQCFITGFLNKAQNVQNTAGGIINLLSANDSSQ